MSKMQFLVVSITVIMLTSAVNAAHHENDPGYDCYPNGTIIVANPNPTVFTSVVATYNDGFNVHMCLASGTEMIAITNCNWMYEITVVFTDHSKMADIISGGTIQAYRIKCYQITEHIIGVNKTLGVTLPVTVKQPVTPSYSISAGFYNQSMSGSPIYTAKIGEIVDFTMMGPVEYYLQPIKCIAYNNPSKASSTSNKTLIEDGCTMDYKLIGDFSRSEARGYFQYTSMFSVFRFYQSSDLYIECAVKVCPQAEECEYFCDEIARKRRQATNVKVNPLDSDTRLATIGRRLRIQDDVIGGSSQLHVSMCLSMLLSVVLMIRLHW